MPDHKAPFQRFDGEPSPEEIEGMLAGDETDTSVRASLEDAFHLEYLRRTLVAVRARNQKEIAEAMGTSQSVVSDIETGRVDPRLSTLQRYARAVGSRLEFRLHADSSAGRDPVALGAATVAADQVVGDIFDALLTQEAKAEPQSPGDVAAVAGRPDEAVPFFQHTMHQLSETGWLDLTQTGSSAEQRFRLRDDRGSVIGVSLGMDRARAVVTRLWSEEILDSAEVMVPTRGPAAVEAAVSNLVGQLRGRAGDSADIVGLGVTLAGRVDPDNGSVLFAPDLMVAPDEWRNVPLQGSLTERTGLNCVVENDANALAIREYLRNGARDNLAVVLMSASTEGIGAGLVVNGSIVRGIAGIAGEIGHIPADPDGIPCRCGVGRGCLETVATETGILRRIRYESDLALSSLEEIAEIAGTNAVVRGVLQRAGRALSRVLVGLAATMGPARIVIYGPAELTTRDRYESAPLFLDPVNLGLDEAIPGIKTEVLARSLEDDAEPLAAAATAVHELLGRPYRWLPGLVDTIEVAQKESSHMFMSSSRISAAR